MARITIRDPATGQSQQVKIVDKRPYWLYDSLTWANAGATDLYYFQDPSGKTSVDTNINQFSALPLGWLFEFHTIRFVMREPVTIADAKVMFGSNTLSFLRQGDIESFRAPAIIFNSGCGLHGVTTTTATDIVTLGQPSYISRIRMAQPIQVKGGETFQFKVHFDAALAGLAASRKVWLILDGILVRPASGG